MHRVFLPETLEIGPHRIGAEEFGIGDVDLFERHGPGALAGIVLEIFGGDVHGGLLPVAVNDRMSQRLPSENGQTRAAACYNQAPCCSILKPVIAP